MDFTIQAPQTDPKKHSFRKDPGSHGAALNTAGARAERAEARDERGESESRRSPLIGGRTPSADDPGVTPTASRDIGDVLSPMFWIILAASLVGVFFGRFSVWSWIPFAVVAIVGGFFIASNWAILFKRRTGEYHSMTLVMGGVLLAIALARCPTPAVRSWWWVPLILDPTCLPMLAGYLWGLVRGMVKHDEMKP